MKSSVRHKWGARKSMKIMVPLLIIIAGGGAFAYFKLTPPQIKRTPPKLQPTAVAVLEVEKTDVTATVAAMGTVVPSREITLRARVTGEIRKMASDFEPGGRIAKNAMIFEIDPSDYEVAVEKALSTLEKAEADLALEKGNQTIAREELQLLEDSLSESMPATDLLLRKPQLKQALATVSSAKAELHQARLNLGRTIVRAPFNALVVERNVNIGSHVGTQDTLATLVCTDTYWVEAAVPLDRLSVIRAGLIRGSSALVRSQTGTGIWHGIVIRVAGKLTEKSRMASVIISIPDPLGLNGDTRSVPLILNDYVSVEIKGRQFSSVIRLPRLALRDGDTVWVYQDGRLDVRQVKVKWKERDEVFLKEGVLAGDKIIVSDLAAPVQGMQLMIFGQNSRGDALDEEKMALSNAKEDIQ